MAGAPCLGVGDGQRQSGPRPCVADGTFGNQLAVQCHSHRHRSTADIACQVRFDANGVSGEIGHHPKIGDIRTGNELEPNRLPDAGRPRI